MTARGDVPGRERGAQKSESQEGEIGAEVRTKDAQPNAANQRNTFEADQGEHGGEQNQIRGSHAPKDDRHATQGTPEILLVRSRRNHRDFPRIAVHP
jgi:hypothetical protein